MKLKDIALFKRNEKGNKSFPVRMLLPIIALALLSSDALFSQNVTYNYSGASQTFTVPEGVTSIVVEAWGAGGGGGGGTTNSSAGGGGGGAYTKYTLPVLGGQVYSINVGQGGVSNTDGGNSSITLGGTTYILASGGKAGNVNGTAGAGGLASASIPSGGTGLVRFSGGSGGTGTGSYGGAGGGGSAGTGGPGGNGASPSGNAGAAGGAAGSGTGGNPGAVGGSGGTRNPGFFGLLGSSAPG